ncbi:hypothetical protein COU57_01310 [Candidatus Pacearchaeota archaeon CG10_big_fil_rev_8_21_14_0_10_32_14]|nr:MAG: hypothetical protein COU57_01310 [Candidatus Pacearchaeota archaeon CG10_big_fil_rev_8_21_14_0_10_32_14]
MPETIEGLGRALTVLGLEDKFLSNGELSNYPLAQRGRITEEIIHEKLSLGRWTTVIRMIYGGLGKADALYDGDREKLKDDIVKSAVEHKEENHSREEVFNVLAKSREDDLIFKLATSIQDLNHEGFISAKSKIDFSFLDDPDQGPARTTTLNEIAAKKALEDHNYESAFYHLDSLHDKRGIGRLFNILLNRNSGIYFNESLAEKISLCDESQKDSRLKRLVLSFGKKNRGLTPLKAYELQRKHNVLLSEEEKTSLYDQISSDAGTYDIEKLAKLQRDPELILLWAKKHSSSEPKVAYELFTQLGYEGEEVDTALLSGLSHDSFMEKHQTLEVSQIDESHLRRIYPNAPLHHQEQIALHLKDKEELKRLRAYLYRQ